MKRLFSILILLIILTSMVQAQNESASVKKDYFYFQTSWQQMNFDKMNTTLQQEGFKSLFENRAYFGVGWDEFRNRSYSGLDFGFSPVQRLRDSSGLRFMGSSLAFIRLRYGYAVVQKESWDLIPYIGVNFNFLTLTQGAYQDSVAQWLRKPVPLQQTTGNSYAIEPGIQFSWMPGLPKKNSAEKDHSLRISLRAGYAINMGKSSWFANQRKLSGPDFAGGPFVSLTIGGVMSDE